MNTRYIVTNRKVHNEKIEGIEGNPIDASQKEWIQVDGKDLATERTRFARIAGNVPLHKFESDPNTIIKLYPHRTLDDGNICTLEDDGAKYGSAALFTDLYKDMRNQDSGGDLLIYIHGYRTSLVDMVNQIDMIEKIYLTPNSPIKHILAFTWPAQDNLVKYRSDIRDTVETGRSLGRTILKLATFYRCFFQNISAPNEDGLIPNPKNDICNRKINILVHSTGARVLQNAMQFLKSDECEDRIGRIFDEVVLMAADVDNQCLEGDQPLSYICDLARRMHVYNHKNDRALLWSQSVKNEYPRLGLNGVRNRTLIPSNAVLVDATDAKDEGKLLEDLINHWYYFNSPKVIKDVIEVLKGEAARSIAEKKKTRTPWPEHPNLYYIS